MARLLALVLPALLAGPLLAQDVPRQAYSKWSYSEKHGYHFSKFTYRPSSGPCEPKTHYCIQKPDDPRYVYYFNPYTKKFWARFDAKAPQGKQFSVLKEEARKPTLEEIAEKEFPEPAAAPKLPEGLDDTPVDPPADLPVPLNPGAPTAPPAPSAADAAPPAV